MVLTILWCTCIKIHPKDFYTEGAKTMMKEKLLQIESKAIKS